MADAAALFDIDGTLIDSNALHVAAWQEAFAGLGHPVEPRAVARLIGMGGDKLVPELWPEADADTVQRLSARHGAIFKGSYLPHARPFPQARALLARAQAAGWTVVLASSASAAEVGHYIGLLDAAELVTTYTSIDDVGASKPAPDIFAVALRKAGIAPDRALAVGDAPYDVEAAAKSGIGTVALLSGGFDRTRLVAAGARAIYADAADLLARFDGSPLAR